MYLPAKECVRKGTWVQIPHSLPVLGCLQQLKNFTVNEAKKHPVLLCVVSLAVKSNVANVQSRVQLPYPAPSFMSGYPSGLRARSAKSLFVSSNLTPDSNMRGSFNGKITGFQLVVKGSIPLPRTNLMRPQYNGEYTGLRNQGWRFDSFRAHHSSNK